jgi:hypothetical protein
MIARRWFFFITKLQKPKIKLNLKCDSYSTWSITKIFRGFDYDGWGPDLVPVPTDLTRDLPSARAYAAVGIVGQGRDLPIFKNYS